MLARVTSRTLLLLTFIGLITITVWKVTWDGMLRCLVS